MDANDHHSNGDDENDAGANFDLDDFLKAGGIDLDDPNAEEEDKEDNNRNSGEEKKEVYNTDPDEKMSGYLVKSSMKLPGKEDADILGMVVNSIGSGMKMGLKFFTETIQIK